MRSINQLLWELSSIWISLTILITRIILKSIFWTFVSFIILLAFHIYVYYKINKIWSRNLPFKSFRNPFGYIEIHIGDECNNNLLTFLHGCMDTINIARAECKDILADTWLISEKNMKEYFEDSVVVLKVGLSQKLVNLINKLKHDRKDRRKCCRYYIQISKVTDRHISKINDKIEEIEERFNSRN